MRVKVCGMTQPQQVEALDELGATFAGFIFYPKSPRYVLRHMTTQQLRSVKSINKVGVFVNASTDEVRFMTEECRLHMVQLHGDETPRYCEKIADYISVVKAFRIAEGDNIEYKVRDYMDVCDMFLFDTAGAGYGGTGKKFDWSLLRDARIGKPWFLSGGIEPGDAPAILELAASPEGRGLFAVDINSRFEVSAGIKDMALIASFIQALQT